MRRTWTATRRMVVSCWMLVLDWRALTLWRNVSLAWSHSAIGVRWTWVSTGFLWEKAMHGSTLDISKLLVHLQQRRARSWRQCGSVGSSLESTAVMRSCRVCVQRDCHRSFLSPSGRGDQLIFWTVNEVIRLHNFLEDSGQNLVDRIVTGHLLHLLYVRARWSDLFAVRNGMVDRHQVFFELETQVHKSAKGADSKSKLLPLVCPCRGINGKDWVACYLKLREDAGLDLPGMSDRCMLPAPSGVESEPWTSRTLTSEEGARFLRKVLGAPKTPERRLSTHSMKSTCISWTSKYGMGFEARALLARHSSSVSNPTAIYSRDLLSPVLRAFVTSLLIYTMDNFHRTRRDQVCWPQNHLVCQRPAPPACICRLWWSVNHISLRIPYLLMSWASNRPTLVMLTQMESWSAKTSPQMLVELTLLKGP